jgi:hypothetical protein
MIQALHRSAFPCSCRAFVVIDGLEELIDLVCAQALSEDTIIGPFVFADNEIDKEYMSGELKYIHI